MSERTLTEVARHVLGEGGLCSSEDIKGQCVWSIRCFETSGQGGLDLGMGAAG